MRAGSAVRPTCFRGLGAMKQFCHQWPKISLHVTGRSNSGYLHGSHTHPPSSSLTALTIVLYDLFQFISYMIRYLPFCKRVCWALGQLHWLREIMVKGDIIAVARCRSPRWPDRVTGFPACPGTHQQLNIVFESDLFI